jgi:hypothetical protein
MVSLDFKDAADKQFQTSLLQKLTHLKNGIYSAGFPCNMRNQ